MCYRESPYSVTENHHTVNLQNFSLLCSSNSIPQRVFTSPGTYHNIIDKKFLCPQSCPAQKTSTPCYSVWQCYNVTGLQCVCYRNPSQSCTEPSLSFPPHFIKRGSAILSRPRKLPSEAPLFFLFCEFLGQRKLLEVSFSICTSVHHKFILSYSRF